MADMILPTASQEIKLLSDLMDKKIAVAIRTGEVTTVPPQAITLDHPDIPIKEPAEAYRVILAYQRLLAVMDPQLKEGSHDSLPNVPALPAERVAGADGRPELAGGGAVDGPVRGSPESGAVESPPGAGGDDGRT